MSLFQSLLDYYHLDIDGYNELQKHYDIDSFLKDHQLNNGLDASNLLLNHLKNKSKIAVFGDYDADGIMATSIIVKLFSYLSYDIEYDLPYRAQGYGLNDEKIYYYINNNFNLIILVDNGVSLIEEVAKLREHQIDVIIIDHHSLGEQLPNANYIIHPIVSQFGDINSSAGFMSFVFSRYILGKSDKYLALLASVSIITDLMPMKSYNYRLFKAVMECYDSKQYLPFSLLLNNEKYDDSKVGFIIGPMINAIGRLIEDESIKDIVKFFTSEDSDYILSYYNYMVEINNKRKQINKEKQESLPDFSNEEAIVIKVDIIEGLAGILANTLLNKYRVPVVVFSSPRNGIMKASARSFAPFNIFDAFKNLSDLCLAYGGHSLAGGCSIKEENFDSFKDKFTKIVIDSNFKPKEEEYIDISIKDISKSNYELIASFAPFGEEHKCPLLRLTNIKPNNLNYHEKGYLMHRLSYNTRIVYFDNCRDLFKDVQYVNLYGQIRDNIFNNFHTYEFFCKKFDNK